MMRRQFLLVFTLSDHIFRLIYLQGRPRKRRRKGGMNQFFEEEAEVDEDDDAEDDEDDLGNDGFVADTHPDDLAALPEGTETDDRRHRELDRRREMEASMDAERQAEALRERYGRRAAANYSNSVVVPKRLMLPGVEDPSIWGVRCKAGKEREVITSVMKRIQERQNSKNPVKILSAFERGGGPMAGYIYVEARQKTDVEQGLDGIMNVYPRSKLNLVPVKEMPDLLRVTKTEELQVGAYVRVKRGLYTGDLGVVEDVESNGLTATVRLVPRLNYGIDEDDKNPMFAANVKGDPLAKRKRMNAVGTNSVANRPPQRLFSEGEARKRHAKYLTPARGAVPGKAWNYKSEFYEEGFLIKDFRIQHLITTNVNPKLDEVTKLTKGAEDGTERLDLESLAQSLKSNTAEGSYQSGDHVEVYEGEQKGISGRTISVAGNIVSIRVDEGELTGQVVDVPMKGLRKRFREGDHVQVIGGSRYRDEVGMILRMKDDRVTVLTDMSMQEITVFSKDLREAGDATADARLGNYDIHDLVQIE
jgi:transcription elongation factor SPT5